MKGRTSFTIDPEILAKLDSVVDNITYRSRSDAVESILRKFFERQHTAVVLCGGDFTLEGTNTYRPLARLPNNSTIIEFLVNTLRVNSFRNIFVSGKTDLLKNVFKLIKNGEGYGVDIKYIDDNNLNGSAKAIERVKEYIGSTTLFITGDVIFDLDLKDLMRFHAAHNSVASIAVSPSSEHVQESKDRVVLKGNRIVSFERLKEPTKTKLVPAPIMVFEPEVFKYIPPGDLAWDLKGDLLPLLAKEGLLFSYMCNGRWLKITKESDLEKAKELL